MTNVNWTWDACQRAQWSEAINEPYLIKTAEGVQELMGYIQSGGGLDFVVVRNSGHMVPIDQPRWSLKIIKDFLRKT